MVIFAQSRPPRRARRAPVSWRRLVVTGGEPVAGGPSCRGTTRSQYSSQGVTTPAGARTAARSPRSSTTRPAVQPARTAAYRATSTCGCGRSGEAAQPVGRQPAAVMPTARRRTRPTVVEPLGAQQRGHSRRVPGVRGQPVATRRVVSLRPRPRVDPPPGGPRGRSARPGSRRSAVATARARHSTSGALRAARAAARCPSSVSDPVDDPGMPVPRCVRWPHATEYGAAAHICWTRHWCAALLAGLDPPAHGNEVPARARPAPPRIAARLGGPVIGSTRGAAPAPAALGVPGVELQVGVAVVGPEPRGRPSGAVSSTQARPSASRARPVNDDRSGRRRRGAAAEVPRRNRHRSTPPQAALVGRDPGARRPSRKVDSSISGAPAPGTDAGRWRTGAPCRRGWWRSGHGSARAVTGCRAGADHVLDRHVQRER